MLLYAEKVLVFNTLIIMSVVKCGTNDILTYTVNDKGKVEIHCPYKSGYEEQEKYLCRGTCRVPFKDIPVKSASKPSDERFSLTDNSTAHIFTITITDLRPSDEGTYWCGIVTGFGSRDDYTKVSLKIKQDNGSLPAMITTTETKPISSTQPTSPSYTVNTSTRISSSSSSHVYPASENPKADLSVILSLSVTVTLVVFGCSLFMYFRQRNKEKDQMINSDAESNIYVISGCDAVHDVSNLHVNPCETAITVYATLQFPTNP